MSAIDNGKAAACPTPYQIQANPSGTGAQVFSDGGLTKREWFAGLAMQGFAADPTSGDFTPEFLARAAVRWADALLAELAKEPAP